VVGRELTFKDPEVVRLASEAFVPVVGDDWYQRRRRDAEGEFFRAVANQGPRKHDGPDGPTRQGLYLLTASGKLLGYRNHHDPAVMRAVIEGALDAWRALPAEERAPGAVRVAERAPDAVDARYERSVPENALVLRVHARVLERGPGGALRRCASVPSGVRGIRPGRDHMWIREAEWRALVAPPGAGEALLEVPDALAQRLCRFHLVDTTRGEPPFWGRGDVRDVQLRLRVTRDAGDTLELALDGRARLALADGARSYAPVLAGRLVFSRSADRFTVFDVGAVGEHVGDGTWNRGAREGAAPLGVFLERIDADTPANTIPPQAARDLGAYFGG
jgi:hypothetical protein